MANDKYQTTNIEPRLKSQLAFCICDLRFAFGVFAPLGDILVGDGGISP